MEVRGADRAELEQWLRAQSIPQALATRARILGSAAGECALAGGTAGGNPNYGLSVAAALPQGGAGGAAHPAASGPTAADQRGQGAGGD